MLHLATGDFPVIATDRATTFGLRFRKARIAAKLTQRDVEKLTDIPQYYISTMERGQQKNPTLDTMARLAAAVAVPLSDLLQD